MFDGEDGMDAEGLTRELCHMMISSMRDGKGGIILFEGQIDHLIPVHNEQYLASRYHKYAGQLIAYCFIHAGFGITGLSRAITEYLKTEMNECLPYVSQDDIPDLDIREKLKQVDPLLFCPGYKHLTGNINFVFLTRKEEVQGNSAMTAKQKLWVVYA